MSKVTIETSTGADGKLNVSTTFDKASTVTDLMNAMEQTHAILLKKLDAYSKNKKKRMSVTIENLFKNEQI